MKEKKTAEIEVLMPQFAESVVSATISKWLKQPGDAVEEYEPLCEIITDKVTAELPSTADGVLSNILVEEGQTVEVGTVICLLQGEDAQTDAAEHAVGDTQAQSDATVATSEQRDESMRHRLSPAVRKLADEHQLNLELIQGTGLGGRITRKDVLAFIHSGEATREAQAQPTTTSPTTTNRSSNERTKVEIPLAPSGSVDVDRGETIIDVTPVRNTIATRMRQSVSEIPHAWTMIEIDVTNLVALRNKLKHEFQKREGINLTYLAFVLKAVVNAIKDYPIMNSVWAVDKIIMKRDINISLAVGTEEAVYTPVIQRADQKNIAGLALEIDELTRKARSGKLSPEDMRGGTITVNNTGSFGSILSQPIINYPQAVNLTFEAIVKRPVVINDMIAVRSMVNMCLSLDHRILDGVVCGQFLQRVKENMEAYDLDTKLY